MDDKSQKPNACVSPELDLALGRVGSLPRAFGLRGPHSSKKGVLQAVDYYKIYYVECYSYT